MKNTHGFRTKGIHNGNFGASKIQAKKETLDLTKEILNRENLRIPSQTEAYMRLQVAYDTTSDPKLKAFLAEQLAKRKAATTLPKVKPNERPKSPYWEEISQIR